jgi:hypothetical protein
MKKPRITLANVNKLQAAVDAAARLHRLGLFLFIAACVLVTTPQAHMPVWLPKAAMVATVLSFVIKVVATRYEIRLASLLARIMAMPHKRGTSGHGSDRSAWSAIRSYIIVSVVLTVAVALTPSMLASLGETALAHLTVMLSAAALAIQSFDNPKRLHSRIMQICSSRVDLHAGDDDVLVA